MGTEAFKAHLWSRYVRPRLRHVVETKLTRSLACLKMLLREAKVQLEVPLYFCGRISLYDDGCLQLHILSIAAGRGERSQ